MIKKSFYTFKIIKYKYFIPCGKTMIVMEIILNIDLTELDKLNT